MTDLYHRIDLWPLKSNLVAIDSIDDEQVSEAKEHLEVRSGHKFDLLAVQYIMEEFRQTLTGRVPNMTLFQFATKTGMIARLKR